MQTRVIKCIGRRTLASALDFQEFLLQDVREAIVDRTELSVVDTDSHDCSTQLRIGDCVQWFADEDLV